MTLLVKSYSISSFNYYANFAPSSKMLDDSHNNHLNLFLPFYTKIALKYDNQEHNLLGSHTNLVYIVFHAK